MTANRWKKSILILIAAALLCAALCACARDEEMTAPEENENTEQAFSVKSAADRVRELVGEVDKDTGEELLVTFVGNELKNGGEYYKFEIEKLVDPGTQQAHLKHVSWYYAAVDGSELFEDPGN